MKKNLFLLALAMMVSLPMMAAKTLKTAAKIPDLNGLVSINGNSNLMYKTSSEFAVTSTCDQTIRTQPDRGARANYKEAKTSAEGTFYRVEGQTGVWINPKDCIILLDAAKITATGNNAGIRINNNRSDWPWQIIFNSSAYITCESGDCISVGYPSTSVRIFPGYKAIKHSAPSKGFLFLTTKGGTAIEVGQLGMTNCSVIASTRSGDVGRVFYGKNYAGKLTLDNCSASNGGGGELLAGFQKGIITMKNCGLSKSYIDKLKKVVYFTPADGRFLYHPYLNPQAKFVTSGGKTIHSKDFAIVNTPGQYYAFGTWGENYRYKDDNNKDFYTPDVAYQINLPATIDGTAAHQFKFAKNKLVSPEYKIEGSVTAFELVSLKGKSAGSVYYLPSVTTLYLKNVRVSPTVSSAWVNTSKCLSVAVEGTNTVNVNKTAFSGDFHFWGTTTSARLDVTAKEYAFYPSSSLTFNNFNLNATSPKTCIYAPKGSTAFNAMEATLRTTTNGTPVFKATPGTSGAFRTANCGFKKDSSTQNFKWDNSAGCFKNGTSIVTSMVITRSNYMRVFFSGTTWSMQKALEDASKPKTPVAQ